MGIEVCIVIVLARAIGLCFLGNRLNRTYNPEAFSDSSESQETENIVSCNQETQKEELQQPKQSSENMNQEEEKVETPNLEEKPNTLELMFNSLRNIGCQPTKDENDVLSVQYQGENFFIRFGGRFACVWDPQWAAVKADDPDLPAIREAINAANFNFGPTVVFSSPNEEGLINIHSRRDIMLHPACPENDIYVKSVLDSFFEKKNDVRGYIHQLNSVQPETQKKRRPVGFATDIS